MLTMDVAEQMQARRHLCNTLQQCLRALVDIVVEIQNTVRWRMGHKHLGIGRNSRIMLILPHRNAVCHNIGRRQLAKLLVCAVRIGQMQDFHI